MKKAIILIVLALVIVAVIFFASRGITGNIILSNYTYTKAICNSSNFCQDYELNCFNHAIVSTKPLPSYAQHSPDWQDPRNSTSLC